MKGYRSRRAALLAGASIIMLAGLLPASAGDTPYDAQARISGNEPAGRGRLALAARRKAEQKSDAKADRAAGPAPSGQLHVVVSIDRQRATLFANGAPVASTPVSTGTKSNPTPMGVFSVIQKNRHHVSNLYNAAMPYMQRITWSGSAMHQGPLPGYPASHGCIRLTTQFAATLWKATKMGTRVIVTKPEVAPVEIQHARLFGPKPKVTAELPVPKRIRTAEASDVAPGAVVQDGTLEVIRAAAETAPAVVPEQLPPGEAIVAAPPAKAAVAPEPTEITSSTPALRPSVPTTPAAAENPKVEQAPKTAAATTPAASTADERWMATEAAAGARDIERRTSPVSVFVSRKDSRLYVRQGMEAVFDAPVTIRNPRQPIGTHVYTAMEVKNETAMRWSSITIPSGFARDPNAVTTKRGKNGKLLTVHPPKPEVDLSQPPSNASAALDRLDLPADAVEKITAMMIPGSSLIMSDNGISHETGQYTDFIILTR